MQKGFENILSKVAETVGVYIAQVITELMQHKDDKKD